MTGYDAASAADALTEHLKPGRLEVPVSGRNPFDIADDVAKHIAKLNNANPVLFRVSDGAAAELVDGKLVPLESGSWLLYVASRVDFIARTKDKDKVVGPPEQVMRIIPAAVLRKLPATNGVASTPYIDGRGDIVTADGYNADTGVILHTDGLDLPPVPAEPSDEDIATAVKLLTVDWLGDFPFASDADRATAVALLLTLTGRALFGLAPLFIIDASTPGAGKGLLVETANLIATGDLPELLQLPTEAEEQRKQVTAALLAGFDPIVWDESPVIAGRALARITTAEFYSDRILGGSKMFTVKNRFTQIAIGNNTQVHGDMKRRVLPCRLEPDCERPQDRDGFRHSDLKVWVREHRPELLAAVLTLWRAWIARGRPRGNATMGSFSQWATAVSGALEVAGISEFLANARSWVEESDDDEPGLASHLADLCEVYGDKPFTAHDVVRDFTRQGLDLPSLPKAEGKSDSDRLGYKYRNIKGRWLDGGLRIVSTGLTHGRTRWRVARKVTAPKVASEPAGNISPSHPSHPNRRSDTKFTPKTSHPQAGRDVTISPRLGRDAPEAKTTSDLHGGRDGEMGEMFPADRRQSSRTPGKVTHSNGHQGPPDWSALTGEATPEFSGGANEAKPGVVEEVW